MFKVRPWRAAHALIPLVLSFAPALAAQQLRVGAGRPYPDIDSALAQASNGALILVDPGIYPPFHVNARSVSIVPSSGSFDVLSTPLLPAIRIERVAAGGSFTLMGCRVVAGDLSSPAIRLDDNLGAVRLMDTTVQLTRSLVSVPIRGVVEARRSTSLWLDGVDVDPLAAGILGSSSLLTASPLGPDDGLAGLVLEESRAYLRNSRFRGLDNPALASTGSAFGGDSLRLIGNAVAVIHGNLSLYAGGRGARVGGSSVHWLRTGLPIANVAHKCATDSQTFRRGPGPLPGGEFAFDYDRGFVATTPFLIERTLATCLYESYGEVDAPAAIPLGSVVTLQVGSFYQRAHALFVGPSTGAPFSVRGFSNTALLDYASSSTVLVDAGMLNLNGQIQVLIYVPIDPTIVGLQLSAQALLGPPFGSQVPLVSFTTGTPLLIVP